MVDPPEEIWRKADQRRAQFDAIALAYDTYRPGYPAATFDDLMELAQLAAGDRVVEVGSGTGIASLPLAERGLRLTCIEPGAGMAALAREKLAAFPQVTHVEVRFEDWDGPSGSARAILCANAWHWVEPAAGFAQAARLLEPEGFLCILFHHIVEIGPPGFADEVRQLRQAMAPPSEQDLRTGAFMEDHDWSEDMRASGLFDPVDITRHGFTRQLSAAEFVASSNTYGPTQGHTEVTRTRVDRAIAELIETRYGGVIAKSEEAILYVGRGRQ
jgi:SAM-dependent methyltransferase